MLVLSLSLSLSLSLYLSLSLSLSQVQVSNRTLHLDPATPTLYNITRGARYYGVNLFCELDTPNEYYIDRARGLLYYWPSHDLQSASIQISVSPHVVVLGADAPELHAVYPDAAPSHPTYAPTFSLGLPDHCRRGTVRGDSHLWEQVDTAGVEFVTIAGFQIQYSTATGLMAPSARNVTVQDCHVTCHGQEGVVLVGHGNRLLRNVVAHTGCGGISVSGGNVPALRRGDNVVQGNRVAEFARWKRTYQPGIRFLGVGNSYVGNTVRDGPHQGMLGAGNDHLFEGNSFVHLCYETTDSAAWYVAAPATLSTVAVHWGATGTRLGLLCCKNPASAEHCADNPPSTSNTAKCSAPLMRNTVSLCYKNPPQIWWRAPSEFPGHGNAGLRNLLYGKREMGAPPDL